VNTCPNVDIVINASSQWSWNGGVRVLAPETMVCPLSASSNIVVGRKMRKYGYPPDKQEKATQTVLMQAEVLPQEWAAVG